MRWIPHIGLLCPEWAQKQLDLAIQGKAVHGRDGLSVLSSQNQGHVTILNTYGVCRCPKQRWTVSHQSWRANYSSNLRLEL
jgi:hypothetical protein